MEKRLEYPPPWVLQQGISEPVSYGDLVYKFKMIVEKPQIINSKRKLKVIKIWLQHSYHATFCMPGCKTNHVL